MEIGPGKCDKPSIDTAAVDGALKSRRLFSPVPVVKLYVDDSVLCVPKKETSNLLDAFNNFNSKLKFTMGLEDHGTVNFMDLMIFRLPDGTLKTDWYRKPINSGRLLSYESNHPMSQKIGMIKSLKKRAYSLSHQDFHEKNKNIIIDLWISNNYPRKLLDRVFNNYCLTNRNIRDHNRFIKYCRFLLLRRLHSKLISL